MLLAEGKFVGSLLYTVLLLSLIPTIAASIAIWFAFFHVGRNRRKPLMLLVIPAIYAIFFLFFMFIYLYRGIATSVISDFSDEIKSNYYTMGNIRYLPVFIFLGGVASFYFIFSNTFKQNITYAKRLIFLLICLLPLGLCAYFSHIAPKIETWLVYRIGVTAYWPFWLLCIPRILLGRTYWQLFTQKHKCDKHTIHIGNVPSGLK